jgi:hypothetical protein
MSRGKKPVSTPAPTARDANAPTTPELRKAYDAGRRAYDDAVREWIPKPLVVKELTDPPSWGIVTDVAPVMPTLICEVPNSPDAKRYADLFAAAPHMYRVLAKLETWLECERSTDTVDALDAVRAALAKARGESDATKA